LSYYYSYISHHHDELDRSIITANMTFSVKESQEQLIQRLTAGFGALLEQVQELAQKNTELEERLTRVRQEVCGCR